MKLKVIPFILLFTLLISSFSCAAPNPLKVHFIDVGEADCILIQTPNGKNILVGAGVNSGSSADSTPVISYLGAKKVSKIDILVGTVIGRDHIGAMSMIINNYQIGSIYMLKLERGPKVYKEVLLAIKNKKLKVNSPLPGSTLDIDPSVKVEVLAPNSRVYDDYHGYSIVLRISYGKTSFLLTGDAEQVSEREMLAKGYNLKADVLKVGFHGYHRSTSEAFLKAVAPKYAVISVGKNNCDLSPSLEVLRRLQQSGITIFRTDLDGTIVATSDGQKIEFDKKVPSVTGNQSGVKY